MQDRSLDPGEKGVHDTVALRRALGCFATGITIITARRADRTATGLTVNSFNSVSLDPPLVLWSLARSSPGRATFDECSHFAVNVLAADQEHLSVRFASARRDKFDGIPARDGLGGAPLIDGVVAQFECRIEARHHGGDHVILVGRVMRCANWDRPPLLYCRGRYTRLA